MADESRPLRLLSLDGGGIRGLSTLLVLRSIMHQLEDIEGPNVPRPLKPADYFDLIGGTSTGGLIAIMLGRLGMDIEQCIKTYLDLSPIIFPTESLLGGSKLGKLFKGAKGTARFPSTPFEAELRKLMTKHGLDEEEKLEAGSDKLSGRAKVFVCCTSQGVNKEVRLRTYRSWEPGTDCTIWQAARATSAAPLFFDPIIFGTPPKTYVDGGVHMNNPIRAVMDEAHSLRARQQEREIGCVVSIGTGIQSSQGVGTRGHQIIAALANAAMDCEKVAREYREELRVANVRPDYFRFSVDGLHGIGLEEWEQFDKLSSATADYLRTHRDEVEKCARAISRQMPSMTCPKQTPPHKLRVKGLPSATNTFIGRSAELANMHSQLVPSKGERKGLVLHGIPGSGKTQLALRYVADYGDTYSHILWISAASDPEAELSFAEAARTIMATGSILSTAKTDRDYIHACLEKHLEPNWLIVLDSLDSLTIGSRHYLPEGNRGSVLITSTRADTKYRYRFSGLEVSGLDEVSACNLLTSLAHLPSTKQSGLENTKEQRFLMQIARQLDCHALALQLSGVLLCRRWVALEHFASTLETKYAEMMDDNPKEWEWAYDKERSVCQAFRILFSELNSVNPASEALLCLCAHYGSWTFSKDFLLYAINSCHDSQILDGLKQGLAMPRDEYGLLKAIDHLADLCLVNIVRDQDGEMKQITLCGPLSRWCMEYLDQRLDWALLACVCIGGSIRREIAAAFVRTFNNSKPKDNLHWHDSVLYDQNMRLNIPAQRCYDQVRKLCKGSIRDTLLGLETRQRKALVAFMEQYGELVYSIGHSPQHYRLAAELLAASIDHDKESQGLDWPLDLDSFLAWTCQALTGLQLNEDRQKEEEMMELVYKTGSKKFPSQEGLLSKIQIKLASMRLRPNIGQPYEAKARLAAFERTVPEDQSSVKSLVVRSLHSYTMQYDTARPESQRLVPSESARSRLRPPSKNPHFFERHAILQLMTEILSDGSRSDSGHDGTVHHGTDSDLSDLRIFVLCGLEGVGKTEIAINYITSQRDEFDEIFCVNANNHDTLLIEIGRMVSEMQAEDGELNYVTPMVDTTEDLVQLGRSWLSSPWVRKDEARHYSTDATFRWLLVLDNVIDISSLEGMWPTHGKWTVLVTTRKSPAFLYNNDAFGRVNSFKVEPLDVESSVKILNTLTQHAVNDDVEETSTELARWTGGFPLLIHQMATKLNFSSLSRLELLAKLDQVGTNIFNGDDEDPGDKDCSRRMAMVSYALGVEYLHFKSQYLLDILCWLDPEKVPERLLDALVRIPEANMDKSVLEMSIEELLSSRLISYEQSARAYGLRAIVQSLVREHMRSDRKVSSLAMALALVTESWVFTDSPMHRDTKCTEMLSSAIKVVSHCIAKFKDGLLIPTVLLVRLFSDSGRYLLESTCEEDPVEYCQNAQAFCEALVIEDTSATARHQLREFYRLSSAAAIETNRPELCVETNLKYQDLIRQQIPSSTKDTKDIFELGLAHNEAGIVHALNKEFDAALKSFQKCADVWSSLENSGGIKVGLPLCNTGMVHTVLKQYDEASSSLVRAASNYAFTLEDDGKRFSSYMGSRVYFARGNLEYRCGRFGGASQFHGHAYEGWMSTLGEDHRCIGDVAHRLSMDYMALVRYHDALIYIKKALKIFGRRTWYRNELARSKYKFGKVNEVLGRRLEAQQAFQEAYDIRSKIVPNDTRPMQELSEDDYDDLVTLWYR